MRRAPILAAMPRSLFLRVSTGLLVIALAIAASAASRDRRFFSARHGVGIEAPAGWTLSQHTGYPNILVVLLHPDGSRVSIAAEPTQARDARALAEQSRRGLEAQHLSITRQGPGPRGGTLVEAQGTGRDDLVRQLYLVRSVGADARQAVVITLVTKRDHLPTGAAGFDWVLAHLELEIPVGRAVQETPDGGRRD